MAAIAKRHIPTPTLPFPPRPSAYYVPPHGSSSSSSIDDAAVATVPVVPNLRTFNLVIATLASAGKWKKALDLSAPMRADKSAASANAAGGWGRERGQRRGDTANNAVVGVAEGLAADAETYTHLIVACGKGGEPDRYAAVCRAAAAANALLSRQASVALRC